MKNVTGKDPKWHKRKPSDEETLAKIYRDRVRDFKSIKSRRRYKIEERPNQLGELLRSYFNQDKEAVRRMEESKALMAWKTSVGEAAARVSKALRVRGSQLIVFVSDPLWMQQLLFLKHDLIKKYQREFPRLKLTDIYFTNRS